MNCCDYDAIEHYAPGTFAGKYKTFLWDSIKETEKDASLGEEQVQSFLNGTYGTYITQKPIVLYRLYGRYQRESENENGSVVGARLGGRFASTEFAESAIDAKLRLALDPKWANTKMYEAKLIVPAGVKISVGIVAPVRLSSGTLLPGGAEQILLPYQWPSAWIQGYRRITGRQLQRVPAYSLKEPPEISAGMKSLYPKVCPMCCGSDVEILPPEKRFDVIGSKGGRYTMQMKCRNPMCGYCW